MSVLVVLTPLQARAADAAPRGPAAGADSRADTAGSAPWKWAWSEDGRQITRQGETAPALWPRADTLVVAVPPQALSWATLDLPKVPAGRLQAALGGALEDTLLEDAEHLHFALPPDAKPGRRATVALLPRDGLLRALQAVEAAGREIDRVVPAFAPAPLPATSPGGVVRVHFQQDDTDGQARCLLVWADEQGVAPLPLEGDGARALVQHAADLTVTWTCTPAAAAAAQAWAGRPVPVVAEAQPWLEAAGTAWELRQFDLAPRHRGLRLGREAWRRFRGPAWRPARVGLAALVAVNVLGLQVWSWQQQQAVEARRQAQVALLKATHPQVRAVLDAPLQMQRESDRLREAAGQPGEADLEAALAAAATAWPAGLAAPQGLRYERGQLTLAAAGIGPTQVAAMGERLRPLGWGVELAGGRLSMTRRAGTPGREAAP